MSGVPGRLVLYSVLDHNQTWIESEALISLLPRHCCLLAQYFLPKSMQLPLPWRRHFRHSPEGVITWHIIAANTGMHRTCGLCQGGDSWVGAGT